MGNLCCRSRHGNSTLACFVGHQAALNTLTERQTEGTAENSIRRKGLRENGAEEQWNAVDVADGQSDDGEYINNCHNGNDAVGNLRNLFDAAEADNSGDNDKHRKGNPVERRVGGNVHAGDFAGDGTNSGNSVEALCWEAQQRINNVQHAERNAGSGRIIQQFACVKGQAADIFVIALFLANLRKRGFCKGRCHAEEGGNPHPEQRARAADGNRTGYTQDIAGTDTHSGGKQKGCE